MGDDRYMEQRDQRNIDFGLKWRKKYDFDGRLNVEKQNKQGLYTAGVWLSEAKKRVEGENRRKPQKEPRCTALRSR